MLKPLLLLLVKLSLKPRPGGGSQWPLLGKKVVVGPGGPALLRFGQPADDPIQGKVALARSKRAL